MKKTLLFLFILGPLMIFGQSRATQVKNQTDREIYVLTTKLDHVLVGNDSEQYKQAKVIELLSTYLSNYKSIMLEKEMENTTLGTSVGKDCSIEKIEYYLDIFKKERFLHIPGKFLQTLGDVNTNCSLKEAVRIYEMVGWEKLGSKDICLIYGCDKFKSDNQPKSRGAKETWKFAGVKKFFSDADNYGWRYFCIKDDGSGRDNTEDIREIAIILENSFKGDTGIPGNLENDMVFPPGYDERNTEWKKRDQVDIW